MANSHTSGFAMLRGALPFFASGRHRCHSIFQHGAAARRNAQSREGAADREGIGMVSKLNVSRRLLGAASALALATGFATPAFAQDDAPLPADATDEAVAV